jgi:hypothetical protein
MTQELTLDYGHWEYPGIIDVNDWFGFIYRIIDIDTDKEYIGKKQFWATQRKIVKGRKNRRVVTKESDWKKYTSSSKYVNEEIAKRGKDRFIFLIEKLVKTKGSLHYCEIETQIDEDVLRAKLPNGERKYYNGMIAGIKFLPADEIAEETRMKIRSSLRLFWQNTDHHYFNKMSDEEKEIWNERYRIGMNNSTKRDRSLEQIQQWIADNYIGENNPMYGVSGPSHPRWGTTHSDEAKKMMSEKMMGRFSGDKNPRYGRSPFENFDDERLQAHKAHLSELMSGENNPMYGTPCHYKMTEEEKSDWKAKISASTKGKPKSEATKERMRHPRGPCVEMTCPECGKVGRGGNMSRYHFDNCKHKK